MLTFEAGPTLQTRQPIKGQCKHFNMLERVKRIICYHISPVFIDSNILKLKIISNGNIK
jgi:hypothetical protein